MERAERKKRKQTMESSDDSSGSDTGASGSSGSDTEQNCSEKFDRTKWMLSFIQEGKLIYDLEKMRIPAQYSNEAVLNLLPSFFRGFELAKLPSLVLETDKIGLQVPSLFSKFCFHVVKTIPYKKKTPKRRIKGMVTFEQQTENRKDASVMHAIRKHIGKMIVELKVLIAGFVHHYAVGVLSANHPNKSITDIIEAKEFYVLSERFKAEYPELHDCIPKRQQCNLAVATIKSQPEYCAVNSQDHKSASETDTEDEEKIFKRKKAKIQESKNKIDMHQQLIAAEQNSVRISRKEKRESQQKLLAKFANDSCIRDIRRAVGYSNCSSSDEVVTSFGIAAYELLIATSEEEIAKSLIKMKEAKQQFDEAKREDPMVGTVEFDSLIKLVSVPENDSSDESDDELEEESEERIHKSVVDNLKAQLNQQCRIIEEYQAAEKRMQQKKQEREEKRRERRMKRNKLPKLSEKQQRELFDDPDMSAVDSEGAVSDSQDIPNRISEPLTVYADSESDIIKKTLNAILEQIP